MFKDRHDAGKQLAKALSKYAELPETVVVALPRGGVVVGYEVANSLHLPLDIVCPRKLASPDNPEYALGVVTETGDVIPPALKDLAEKEIKIAQERLHKFREGMPPRDFVGKRIILIDDGIATGSTLIGAIKTLEKERAREIILAVPVAPLESLRKFISLVDSIVCLETPTPFYAVGQFYKDFEQTTDEEVNTLLHVTL
ncbi:MAG: phosphoribosyltransferase [Chlamydiales bacterium]|nr:phosphoribosyltransferase [Chlamydiales bacterium]